MGVCMYTVCTKVKGGIWCPGPGVTGGWAVCRECRHSTLLFTVLRGSKCPLLLSRLSSSSSSILNSLSSRHSNEHGLDLTHGFVVVVLMLWKCNSFTSIWTELEWWDTETQFQMCPFSFPKFFTKSLLRKKKAPSSSTKWHPIILATLLLKTLAKPNPCSVIEEEVISFAYWPEVSRVILANQDHEYEQDRPTSMDKTWSN